MPASPPIRRILICTVTVLGVLIVLVAALLAALQTGHCRGLLTRFVGARLGHPIQVEGAFEAHLFSRNPRIIADQVVVQNPTWTRPGITARVGTVTAVFQIPGFGRPADILSLELKGAAFYLARDEKGRANWQLADPAKRRAFNENSPIVRSVSMPNAHILLDDTRRHLKFDGIVSAMSPPEPGSGQSLRVEGAGRLNGRTASFEITADSLASANHQTPYHFTFAEHSGGSRLEGHGSMPRPFDFDVLDAAFEATGPDLKDLYFLVGVSLIDTGPYHLSGTLLRRGNTTRFNDIAAASGESDVHGTVSIESSTDRPRLDLALDSRILRLSDLGARAAGRAPLPPSPLLLSDAALNPDTLRRDDATVKFTAHRVDVGRVPLHELSATATIERGVLTVEPLVAEMFGGTIKAHLRLDATHGIPVARVGIDIADLQLGEFVRRDAGPPAIEGQMQVKVAVTGTGSSVHQVAASAEGTVSMRLPRGAIRDSLAELTGVDLRGLGLFLSKNKAEVPVRCAVTHFEAHQGTLIARSPVLDTEAVLITGEGQIHLDTEALDLEIRGHPKSLRLFRLRSPIQVRGTLAHPTIDIEKSKSVLVIVDPGHAKDADCATLLAEH